MNNEKNIIEENMEQSNVELLEVEESEELGEIQQGNDEELTETQQENLEGMEEKEESVSQGDSVIESAHSEEILEELKWANQQLEALVTYQEVDNQAVFDKPLEDFTTAEGIQLMLLLTIIVVSIFKLIGGIIRCEI